MADTPPTLSTTSYAVLGLLCVQDWSAYDLAQQMKRSTLYVWPRAESGVYNEPKKLLAHGFATARTERTGNRSRQVYAATASGREAMTTWLRTEARPPTFESEALLRVWFLDQGSREDLLANVEQFRNSCLRSLHDGLTLTAQYLEVGEGPFPHRRHSHLLTAHFVINYFATMIRWADWARSEISTWPEIPTDDLSFLGDALVGLRESIASLTDEFGDAMDAGDST